MPIQKSLNMDPSISSTSTLPTILPRCRVAILRSSAANSKSLFWSFFRNLSISFKHSFSFALCLSLVIKALLFDENFLLSFCLIKFINLSIFLLSFTEASTASTSNLWFSLAWTSDLFSKTIESLLIRDLILSLIFCLYYQLLQYLNRPL